MRGDSRARGWGQGATALHLAAQAGHTETVQVLLTAGANVHATTTTTAAAAEGVTALQLAAEACDVRTLRLLLSHCAQNCGGPLHKSVLARLPATLPLRRRRDSALLA